MGVIWDTNTNWGEGNYTGSGGEAATCSSDVAGTLDYDTELCTPILPVATLPTNILSYLANYQNLSGYDFLDVDISVDGGPWQTVLSWNEDHGAFRAAPSPGRPRPAARRSARDRSPSPSARASRAGA